MAQDTPAAGKFQGFRVREATGWLASASIPNRRGVKDLKNVTILKMLTLICAISICHAVSIFPSAGRKAAMDCDIAS
jgi:hypothetical protein